MDVGSKRVSKEILELPPPPEDKLARFTKLRLSRVLSGTGVIVRRLNVLKKLTLVKAFFMVKESGSSRARLQKRLHATRTLVAALRKPVVA